MCYSERANEKSVSKEISLDTLYRKVEAAIKDLEPYCFCLYCTVEIAAYEVQSSR